MAQAKNIREEQAALNPVAVEALSTKPDREYMRAKDREIVRGIFRYFEVPGGSVSFPFRKWPGDPIETYHLVDGCIYSLPLGVAKHLNNNCWYPIHRHRVDENGKPSVFVGSKVKRTAFQSLEFMDLDETRVFHGDPTDNMSSVLR